MDKGEARKKWEEAHPNVDPDQGDPLKTYQSNKENSVPSSLNSKLSSMTFSGSATLAGTASDTFSSNATVNDSSSQSLSSTSTIDSTPSTTFSSSSTIASNEQSQASQTFSGQTLLPPQSSPTSSHPEKNDSEEVSFRLMKELGQGGMGVVFQAFQGSLQREIAVKKVLPGQSKRANDKFVSEAMVTGLLDHPNIIPVHDLGATPEGEVMLAMKLVRGVEWGQLIHNTESDSDSSPSMTQEDHLKVLISVCHAVAYAHSKDVVHLDLKPENVMVNREFGEVLVMDWGIAAYCGENIDSAPTISTSHISGPCGTPAYMAPELAEGDGERIGPHTDVYLLGAVLHEILTKQPPHQDRSIAMVLIQAAESIPPTFAKSVPTELQAICKRALSKDPQARHGSVKELREDLEAFLSHKESLEVSDRAQEKFRGCRDVLSKSPEQATDLNSAERRALYHDFATCVADFEQALRMWPENKEAHDGQRLACLHYANFALDIGDIGLAEAQFEKLSLGKEKSRLRKRIKTERELEERSTRAARLYKRVLRIGVTVIVVGLSVGFFLVKRSRDQALIAKTEADEQRALAVRSDFEARTLVTEFELIRSVEQCEQLGTSGLRRVMKNTIGIAGRGIDLEKELAEKQIEVKEAVSDRLQGIRETSLRVAHLMLNQQLFLAPTDQLGWAFGRIESGAYSRDGGRLLAGTETGALIVWDTKTGKPVRTLNGHRSAVTSCDYSPDGLRMATASLDGTIRIWDKESGQVLHRLNGHKAEVSSCQFSPDGLSLLSASLDGTGTLWNVADGKPKFHLKGHKDGIVQARFSPDGELLLSASMDQTLRLWSASDGALIKTLEGHERGVTACAFAPDGKTLASAGRDNRLKIWDRGGTLLQSWKVEAYISDWTHFDHRLNRTVKRRARPCLTFASDGSLLSGFGNISRWNANDGTELIDGESSLGGGWSACFTSKNGTVAGITRSGQLVLWDPDLKSQRRRLDRPLANLSTTAQSPNGLFILTGSWSGELTLWDRKRKRKLKQLRGHSEKISEISFSRDSRYALSCGFDKRTFLWDLQTGKAVWCHTAPKRGFYGCRFVPGTKDVLLSSGNGIVSLRSRRDGSLIKEFRGHKGFTGALACSADGRYFASGDGSGVLKLWDRMTGRMLWSIQAHSAPVEHCAISDDGKLIVSGAWNGRVTLWNRESGARIRDFAATALPIVALGISGEEVLAVNSTKLFIWDLKTGQLRKGIESQGREFVSGQLMGQSEIMLVSRGGLHQFWKPQELERHRVLAEERQAIRDVVYSSNGKLLASASNNGEIKIWNSQSGRLQQRLRGHKAPVLSLDFSKDGQRLLSGSSDGVCKLWTLHTKDDSVEYFRGRSGVRVCQFSPKGSLIFVATQTEINLFDGSLDDRCGVGNTQGISAATFSADGKYILSGHEDGTLQTWPILDGRSINSYIEGPRVHTMSVNRIFLTKKGECLTSSDDRSMKIWHKKASRVFEGHRDVVTDGEVSSNGQLILSASRDGTLKLWDRHTRAAILSLRGHSGSVTSCSLAPDGRSVASGSEDGQVRVWRLIQYSADQLFPGKDTDLVGALEHGTRNALEFGRTDLPPLESISPLMNEEK